jgi:uncharacterized protein (DUF4415 family)
MRKKTTKKREINSTSKTVEFETTPQDQEKMRADGIPEDEIPPVGVRRYGRARHRVSPRDAKVKISLYIDGDILEYFRRRAEPPHAAPYQTQINNELRKIMEADTNETVGLENDILNNEVFLRALKEKLAMV